MAPKRFVEGKTSQLSNNSPTFILASSQTSVTIYFVSKGRKFLFEIINMSVVVPFWFLGFSLFS